MNNSHVFLRSDSSVSFLPNHVSWWSLDYDSFFIKHIFLAAVLFLRIKNPKNLIQNNWKYQFIRPYQYLRFMTCKQKLYYFSYSCIKWTTNYVSLFKSNVFLQSDKTLKDYSTNSPVFIFWLSFITEQNVWQVCICSNFDTIK